MRAVITHYLLRFFALLPLPINHLFGAAIGKLLQLIPNQLSRISRINIDMCMPELSARQRQQLLHASLAESGKTLSESGLIWLNDSKKVFSFIQEISGEEALQNTIKQGRGVILAIPHLGCWELIGLYCSSRYPMTSMYRPPRMAAMDNMLRQARQRCGAKLVPANTQGVRALYQALKKGEMCGILPDQEPSQGNGAFIDFFGQSAYTALLTPRLAHKTKAAIFFAYAERLPRGRGYHLHFIQGENDHDETSLPEDDALKQGLKQINDGVEHCIRKLPDQYQWGYKRFRSQADGKPSPY